MVAVVGESEGQTGALGKRVEAASCASAASASARTRQTRNLAVGVKLTDCGGAMRFDVPTHLPLSESAPNPDR